MTKKLSYRDIQEMTRSSSYSIDLAWKDIKWWLDSQAKDGILDIDPDFQRGHVWTAEKQSNYIEYILRGGLFSKEIYFNCPNYTGGTDPVGPMQLVDGKQRMTAIFGWIDNKVSIFDGVFIGDMIGRARGHIATIKLHVNDLQTRAEVLQWYLDLNSGGVVHTEDELVKVRNMLEIELKEIEV